MAFKTAKKAKKQIDSIQAELKLQRTNHLEHIQKAVEDMGSKQDKTNLELAEQTGVLNTIAKLLTKN